MEHVGDARPHQEDQREHFHEDEEGDGDVAEQVGGEHEEGVGDQHPGHPHHRRSRFGRRLVSTVDLVLDPEEEVDEQPGEEHVEVLQGGDEEDLVDFADAAD